MAAPAPRRGRNVNALQALALVGAFVLVSALGGVLTAGLAMPGVAAAGGLANTSTRFFDELPSALEQKPLSQQSRIYAADGSLMATFYWENRIVVSLAEVAEPMKQAVIATEDKRFYEHGGIDPQGLVRALVKNITSDATQGGSTLTQQYVKNVLVEAAHSADDAAGVAAARETTLIRKLREAKLAIALEKRMTKDEILESYLNISQFGASVYGVEAASRHYFGKSAKDLTYVEAALLAGITQSPNKWDPVNNPTGALERRDVVLGLMRDQGVITAAEYTDGVAITMEQMLEHATQDKPGCRAAGDSAFFCDYVTKVIANDPAFGQTKEERVNRLYRGGLEIHTTLDPRLQTIAMTEIRATVPDTDPSGLGISSVTVEPGTGKILTMAQNRTYDPSTEPPVGSTSVNFNTDYLYGNSRGFQPGSAFKPFVLTAWLESGHSLSEYVDATQKLRKLSTFQASCLGPNAFVDSGKPWRPGNVDGHGTGYMTVLKATANSINTAYVDMANQLDMCNIVDVANRLGFHRADGEDVQILPSTTLGTQEVAPLTMAASFATFAANGTYCAPIAITEVLDKDGNPLPVPTADCRQVVEPRIASAVAYAMSKVVTEGTAKGNSLAGGRASAGKTGTTNDNVYMWFVGYTPQLSTAVWLGNPDASQSLNGTTINGHTWRYLYGADLNAPTWKRIMDQALDGQPAIPFPAVGNKELYGELIRVPSVVGLSPDDARTQLTAAGFHPIVETEPVFSPTVPIGAVADTNPPAGASTSKGGLVRILISQGPDPAAQPAFPWPGDPGSPGNPGGDAPGNNPNIP